MNWKSILDFIKRLLATLLKVNAAPSVVAPSVVAPSVVGADIKYGPFEGGESYTFDTPPSALSLNVAFSFEGLDHRKCADYDAWLWAIRGRSDSGAEYNVQLHVYRESTLGVDIRFITQNHGIPSHGKSFSEYPDHIPRVELFPGNRYDVRIVGPVRHTEKDYMVWRMTWECAGVRVGTWEVLYMGLFSAIESMRVGNGGIFEGKHGRAAQDAPLTVINPVARFG